MTFSMPVTPTRESETLSVGRWDWTSGWDRGVCAIAVGKGSETRKTAPAAVFEGTERPSACRSLCYHSPSSGVDRYLGERWRERVEHDQDRPAARRRGADHGDRGVPRADRRGQRARLPLPRTDQVQARRGRG